MRFQPLFSTALSHVLSLKAFWTAQRHNYLIDRTSKLPWIKVIVSKENESSKSAVFIHGSLLVYNTRLTGYTPWKRQLFIHTHVSIAFVFSTRHSSYVTSFPQSLSLMDLGKVLHCRIFSNSLLLLRYTRQLPSRNCSNQDFQFHTI